MPADVPLGPPRCRLNQGTATSAGSPGADVWVRTVTGWHVAFWALLAITAISVAIGPDGAGSAWPALVLLAVLGASYQLLGAPWLMLDRMRTAALATVALTLAAAAALVGASGASPDNVRVVSLSMGVSLLFSLALGLWITSVIDQSRHRADLIRELQHTRAELAEAHHAQGVLAERERMAQEIHDTLAQGFTSVVMLAQTAQAELASKPAAVPGRLTSIEQTARDNLAEARALVATFAPVPLHGAGLPTALQRLADRFRRETGLTITVDLPADVAPLPADRQVVLLRAAQEALANVRQHAGARSVLLRLRPDGPGIAVEVVDDGIGFDPAAAGGYGLAGMRRRVADAGGAMDVQTGPGEGTRILVRVPIPDPGAA